MASADADTILDLVGSRRYCFVVMPYGSLALFYEHVRELIHQATGLRCIRADEVGGGGQPLLAKVQALIQHAELVVAELSEPKPNVYYEVGDAAALEKEVLVICQEGTRIPTDLKGLERIEYKQETRGALTQFDAEFRTRLVTLIDSDLRLLRAMLVAPEPSPSYILCSPRWRMAEGEVHPHTRERRTFGDYLGVVGIIYALGALLGKERLPELLSAQRLAEGLLENDCNFYLIGSSRSNTLTADALESLQEKTKRTSTCGLPGRLPVSSVPSRSLCRPILA